MSTCQRVHGMSPIILQCIVNWARNATNMQNVFCYVRLLVPPDRIYTLLGNCSPVVGEFPTYVGVPIRFASGGGWCV